MIIYCILSLKSDWKLIHATDLQEKSSWDTLSNIQSFYTFNHRGKALYNPQYEQPGVISSDAL
jgi:membrane magnesium transporter 1